jgi:hypothetical protein
MEQEENRKYDQGSTGTSGTDFCHLESKVFPGLFSKMGIIKKGGGN